MLAVVLVGLDEEGAADVVLVEDAVGLLQRLLRGLPVPGEDPRALCGQTRTLVRVLDLEDAEEEKRRYLRVLKGPKEPHDHATA